MLTSLSMPTELVNCYTVKTSEWNYKEDNTYSLEPPSSEMLKSRPGMVLGNLLWAGVKDYTVPRGAFQPQPCCDSVILPLPVCNTEITGCICIAYYTEAMSQLGHMGHCSSGTLPSYPSESWAQRSFPVPAFLLEGSPRGLATCLANLQPGSVGQKVKFTD